MVRKTRGAEYAEYSFVGACPSLPSWFVNWVSDEDTSRQVEFDELGDALRGEPTFEEYMHYRVHDIEIHPRDDWSIDFRKGLTPLGRRFMVIQDSGIEHVYVRGHLNLEDEKQEAERRGFEWMDNPTPNPDTTAAKRRAMRG